MTGLRNYFASLLIFICCFIYFHTVTLHPAFLIPPPLKYPRNAIYVYIYIYKLTGDNLNVQMDFIIIIYLFIHRSSVSTANEPHPKIAPMANRMTGIAKIEQQSSDHGHPIFLLIIIKYNK